MKRLLTLAILITVTISFASAQVVTERCWHLDRVQFLAHKQDFWRTHLLYSTAARPYATTTGGFYNLTEFQYGFGVKIISDPFSHHYAGITTVNGWQFGNGLAMGIGVGYHQYNEGYGIPLYGDFRWYLGRQRVKFFLMASGGVLGNFENFKEYSCIFANPGGGIIVPLAKNMHLSYSVGFLSQWDHNLWVPGDAYRDSFINMKLGLLFGK